MYGAINTLFLLESLCPVRNGIFTNTDSLALAWSWAQQKEISVFFRIGGQTVFVNLSNSHAYFSVFSMFGKMYEVSEIKMPLDTKFLGKKIVYL